MTREDIIRMAWEAGLLPGEYTGRLEVFAALVAAAEREACAKFLESGVDLKGLAGDRQLQAFCGALLMGCAKAIRERGNS